MDLQYKELEKGIRLIQLQGKLDVEGANSIDTKFNGYCSGEKPLMVVDLAGVDFIASFGIRMLTLAAKSITVRGGRMVLINPSAEVHQLLEMTGVPSIIPIYSSLESAETVLLAKPASSTEETQKAGH